MRKWFASLVAVTLCWMPQATEAVACCKCTTGNNTTTDKYKIALIRLMHFTTTVTRVRGKNATKCHFRNQEVTVCYYCASFLNVTISVVVNITIDIVLLLHLKQFLLTKVKNLFLRH